MSSEQAAAAAEVNASLKPAPLPNANTAAHATDSQGVRKLDSEDLKSHGLDPATSKKKSKTAPKSSQRTNAVSSTPVNDLRAVAASLPLQDVRHDEPNWFIPLFAMMFTFLGHMCDKVAAERPFGDRGTINDWIPQSTILVYSVLAIVQCLRAQELSGLISPEQHQFLKFFIETYPLETLVIPGPLVPFFRSLSVSAPGFGSFMDVSPAIPPFSLSEETFYTPLWTPPVTGAQAHSHIGTMIPNIPLMYDQFVHLVKYIASSTATTPRHYSTYEVLRSIYSHARPAAAGASRTHFDNQRRSLGFSHRPVAADGLYTRFVANILGHAASFPPPLVRDDTHAGDATATPPVAATWTHLNSFVSFMQMHDRIAWFSVLLRGQERFTSFWKGNQPMLKIHPSTSTAGMITFDHVQLANIATTGNAFAPQATLNHSSRQWIFNTQLRTTCPFITNEDAQDSQIAQINCADDDHQIGTLNITRFGPFWSVSPNVYTTSRANITNELTNMVLTTVFFDSKAQQVQDSVFQ